MTQNIIFGHQYTGIFLNILGRLKFATNVEIKQVFINSTKQIF